MVFIPMITSVEIPGGSPVPFPVKWVFHPDDLPYDGPHTMRAIFIASGQETTKSFIIQFG